MSAITLAPLLLVLAVSLWKGPRQALAWVAVPSLLFLPSYYTWKLPGIPRFDFHNYMLLAAAVLIVVRRGRWFSLRASDVLLVLYLLLVTWSELENKGFEESRNLLVLTVMSFAVPYVLGRALAEDASLLLAVVFVLLVCGAAIGWVSVFEARMGRNPFDVWRSVWPNAVPWDGALYRAGLRRVAGPFAHPICHGFFFSMALPLAHWLLHDKLRVGRCGRWFLYGGLCLGLAMSLSRGPVIGTLLAFGILTFGWSRRRGVLVAVAGFCLFVGAALYGSAGAELLSMERGDATSAMQETAAYRSEMLQNYLEVVAERPWLGFGKDQFPVVKGLKSIDNQYLFLALTHGLPPAFLFLGLLVVPILVSLPRLLRAQRTARTRLQWALIGILGGSIVTQLTVFSGTQTAQVLALVEGLTVGLAAVSSRDQRAKTVSP